MIIYSWHHSILIQHLLSMPTCEAGGCSLVQLYLQAAPRPGVTLPWAALPPPSHFCVFLPFPPPSGAGEWKSKAAAVSLVQERQMPWTLLESGSGAGLPWTGEASSPRSRDWGSLAFSRPLLPPPPPAHQLPGPGPGPQPYSPVSGAVGNGIRRDHEQASPS